jgi:hypothetical protein
MFRAVKGQGELKQQRNFFRAKKLPGELKFTQVKYIYFLNSKYFRLWKYLPMTVLCRELYEIKLKTLLGNQNQIM